MATAALPLQHDMRVIGVVGAAHGGSHFFHLVLPPLFPLLKAAFGVGYAELGFLMSMFFAASGLCQTPVGFLVDRIGAARVLAEGYLPWRWRRAGEPGAVLSDAAGGGRGHGAGQQRVPPGGLRHPGASRAPNRMARAFSVHTVGGTLGWAVAPVLVAGIAALASWRTALLVSG